ncbi:MAG TPA: biopolymer transporter ExbD [Tepidisphaeraceae bacterium]|nr:biopolymer transporter ExbD [Tepidisphaeraceae bacterium]
MRRRHRMPEVREGGVNVTPLIDVVMCLIIFFMLVAKIGVAQGVDPTIDLPASRLGQDLAEQQLKDPGQALTLNVRRGALDLPLVTALVEGGTNAPQEIKLVDAASGKKPLLEVLKRIKTGADRRPNTPDDKNLKIIIRGDQDMPYQFLEPVLVTCAEARVRSVNFNTRKVVE